MTNEKVTKKEILAAIIALVGRKDPDWSITVDDKRVSKEDIENYAYKTIEQMKDKDNKAKIRQAKQKYDDIILWQVKKVLADEYQTITQIAEAIPNTLYDNNHKEIEVTKAKIVARLTTLVKDGYAEKEEVKVESRKVMAYRVAKAESEDVEVVEDVE